MKLKEYIYIDQERLESFFQQVSSPVKNEKKTGGKFSFGLTKLEGEVNFNTEGRPYTNHEKIELLLEYLKLPPDMLKDFDSIQQFELTHDDSRKDFFRLLRVNMTRVLIPIKPKNELVKQLLSDKQFIAMWINNDPTVKVYILEDYSKNNYGFVQAYSSYSTISFLLNDLPESGTLIHEYFAFSNNNNTLEMEFLKDPIEVLKQLGAVVQNSREIDALLRIRASFVDMVNNDWQSVLVGYPIFISS